MSDRKRSLTDICGGRFAFMPVAACEDSDLPNGPFRLYAAMCAQATKDGVCKIHLKYIAKKLGVSARTVQMWKRDLELLGWVQQLNVGDKAIGSFRVIRDPSERNPVRASNAIKVGIRSAAKTPHATKASHPRCEKNCTYNKNQVRTPLSLPVETTAERSSPSVGPDQARQGNPVVAGSGPNPLPFRKLNQKTPTKQPDWHFWARWLTATRPMNEEETWLWLNEEIDRLKKENGIDPEEAGWMLHRQLRKEKESGE